MKWWGSFFWFMGKAHKKARKMSVCMCVWGEEKCRGGSMGSKSQRFRVLVGWLCNTVIQTNKQSNKQQKTQAGDKLHLYNQTYKLLGIWFTIFPSDWSHTSEYWIQWKAWLPDKYLPCNGDNLACLTKPEEKLNHTAEVALCVCGWGWVAF